MHDSYSKCTLSCISMTSLFFFLCTLLIFSLYFHGISGAIPKYVVINEVPTHGGGIKFDKVIGGIPYIKKIVCHINKYIWYKVFKQNTRADQKPLDNVTVFIKDFVGVEAVTWGSEKINVSAVFLRDYPGPMDLKWEFTSLMHHEMTHVFLWNGEGKTPAPLVEGIADYTVLKANYFPPGFTKPGSGDRWDEGYVHTALFLEYCDELVPDFVAKLNKMMRKTYDVSFFQSLTGKPVEELWKDYKAKYANKAFEGIQG
ncbi:hypothetical protein HanXRQr2_Chr03g0111481 [Helianthus annuus]|uniref:Plant basic secretory protein (BSP) family protein n=2 Tax=Helianthus annuus TaxID=4232 RepID=A0A9K3NV64_HELAN|nr:hypothetical protein HanXRQr2_Chr03g0111481 [Helianthus annuus]